MENAGECSSNKIMRQRGRCANWPRDEPSSQTRRPRKGTSKPSRSAHVNIPPADRPLTSQPSPVRWPTETDAMCYRPALTAVVIAVGTGSVHSRPRTDPCYRRRPGGPRDRRDQCRLARRRGDGHQHRDQSIAGRHLAERRPILDPGAAPGTYQVSVDLPSFARAVREGVTLALGAQVDLAFSLQLAGTTEAITVTGEAPLVDSQKTAVATVVSRQQIESLPIDGRNFMSFAVITPGVSHRSHAATGRVGNLRADLRRAARTIEQHHRGRAEQQRRGGGQRAGHLQSGGGARVPGAHQLVHLRVRQRHRRRAEHRDQERHQPVHRQRVRLFSRRCAQRQGAFRESRSVGRARQSGEGALQPGAIRGNARRADSEGQDLFLPVCRAAGYRREQPRDDRRPYRRPAPVSRRAPWNAGADSSRRRVSGRNRQRPYDVTNTQFLAKVDHQLAQNHSLVLRFNTGDAVNENTEPFGGITAKSRAAALDARDYIVAASQTSVFSSRWVNELRFQFAYRDQLVRSLDPLCGGECLIADQGGPTLEVTGVASVGRQRFTPQTRTNALWQFVDTVSLSTGGHLIKAGFDVEIHPTISPTAPFCRCTSAAATSSSNSRRSPACCPRRCNSIQAVALGLPAAYVQGYGVDTDLYDNSSVALFIQDDWRLGSQVTLKYGVRYQKQFWQDITYSAAGLPGHVHVPVRRQQHRAARGDIVGPGRRTQDRRPRRLRVVLREPHHGRRRHHGSARWRRPRPYARADLPASLPRGTRPGHRLPEAAAGTFPTLKFLIDPGLESPYAHHGIDRRRSRTARTNGAVGRPCLRARLQPDRHDRLQPRGAGARPWPTAQDVNGVAGTSASILQYTTFGETWYKGLTVSLNERTPGVTSFS